MWSTCNAPCPSGGSIVPCPRSCARCEPVQCTYTSPLVCIRQRLSHKQVSGERDSKYVARLAPALVHGCADLEVLVIEQAWTAAQDVMRRRRASTTIRCEESSTPFKRYKANRPVRCRGRALEALINLHGALLVREDLEARVCLHTGKARVSNDLPAAAASPAACLPAGHPAHDHGPACSAAALYIRYQRTVR